MGILDHHRTWVFETSASPEACLNAFVDTLTKGGLLLLGSRWSVSRSRAPDGRLQAVATYTGRGGVVGALTPISQRASSERDAAIGSTLAFQVANGGTTGGRVRATMAMTQTAKILLFFTADARFLRNAMNRVARTMRSIDPSLTVVKS